MERAGKHNDDDNDDEERDDSSQENLAKLVVLLLQHLLSDRSSDCDDPEYHRVSCDGCGINGFKIDRYKCLKCENFDLCARCFDRRKESAQHKSGHPMAHFKLPNELFGKKYDNYKDVTMTNLQKEYADEVNTNIYCDFCRKDDFKGLRFKCDTCPDYDLCQQCVDNGKTNKGHKSDHPMIVAHNASLSQIDRRDIDYDEDDFLGGGAFGKVYKAKWLSKNLTVACKVIHARAETAKTDVKAFLKELAAYRELSEYLDKGSLTRVIYKENVSLRRKLEMALNIASGMRKIHQHGMIHRDIKPDNILVTSHYTAKIGDMGIARVLDPNVAITHIGPQQFMPPEFQTGEYDQKLDVYTFGLTLNELFTETKHKFDIFTGRKTLTTQSPILSELITRCIDSDPKQRPTARNEMFMAFYKQFHPIAKKEIEKIFPLPPRSVTNAAAGRSQTTDAGRRGEAATKVDLARLQELLSSCKTQ
ncbi:unnamed protein product [Didymodactylos carnosus]|uniref:Uncharacterized protein n=1 Tax=Didymodactylos carnosus TaxID=1234261 RepID=A0A8S2M1H9_9BILA|nr:unnamed protein product [Didymodactylos carnosus]